MTAKTAWTAAALTESDINTYLTHTGSAWETWTPTVAQSVGVAVTVNRARYFRSGRMITWNCNLTVTGAGSAGVAIYVLLPVTAAIGSDSHGGGGYLYDSSATFYYPAIPVAATTTTVQLISTATSGVANPLLGVVDFTAALAVNDVILLAGTYEAAS
tara:strand:+ start:977 stop:1450 length:474 start_codon:yes stop_codon:yes gene_type:complete